MLKGPSLKGLEQKSPLIWTYTKQENVNTAKKKSLFVQSFEHRDIIKYLYSGDSIYIKYDTFKNDNIQLLKTSNSTHKVLYLVGSSQEQWATCQQQHSQHWYGH